jgi:hypothetical protein
MRPAGRSLVTALLLSTVPAGAAAAEYVVKAQGKDCAAGLHRQPAGGPFSVFLFCDDAAGSNIGVVNTEGAAGPGRIELPPPRTWDKWAPANRFWQDPEWAADVTSFAWAPDLKSLYVGTSGIYGSGSLYKLDLVRRTYARLIPKPDDRRSKDVDYSAEITALDMRTGEVSVSVTAQGGTPSPKVTKHLVK